MAQVRDARSWEYGPFVNYGNGVGDRSTSSSSGAASSWAKPLSPVVHAGIFSGQFELGGNIMPLWQAYTPAPHSRPSITWARLPDSRCSYVARSAAAPIAASASPRSSSAGTSSLGRERIQPWFQGAGGLIYTTHKFPPRSTGSQGTPGGTSVWNFSPQGGIGFHYFTAPKRSIDLGVKRVHISSASLGDRNPGVNASIQIQVGYTYWK